MLRRFGIELKLGALILFLLVIVITTGVVAYRNFTRIINNATTSARPDMKLVLFERLRFDISNAESSVRSYNLTRDESYLSEFYSSVSSIESLMKEIRMAVVTDSAQTYLLDSLSILVDEKYDVLGDILQLKNNEKVTDELKRIALKLEETTSVQESRPVPHEDAMSDDEKTEPERPIVISDKKEPAKRLNFFQRFLGKKQKPDPAKDQNKTEVITQTPEKGEKKVTTETIPTAVPSLKKVKNEVGKQISVVKNEQIKQLKNIKYKELQLLLHDRDIMNHLQSLIVELQNKEREKISLKTMRTSLLARRTNRIIGAFCLVATLLLLIVSYSIITYMKKNKSYNAALKNAKAEAEKLAETKEKFLANMSHEIRTPMNAIAGFTEQLLQTRLDIAQKEQLQIVKNSSDHLLKILNQILDYSKIQAGMFRFEEHVFDLKSLINEVVILMENTARKKHLPLRIIYHNSLPRFVAGDDGRLREILYNILSNAIKFTEKGSVTIEVSGQMQSNTETTLAIKVKDTGIGIARHNLRKVFNEFEQTDAAISGNYGGTGLGLSITKKLIELLGGELELQSELGKGTTVNFSIPLRIASEDKIETKPAELKFNFHRKRILIADDEIYNRRLLETILKKWNARITIVTNGKEVLSEYEKNDYDLLILDIRMPEMSGEEVCKYIRSLEMDKSKVPIIALTAIASNEEMTRYRSVGFNETISKPFSEKELYEKITELFNPGINGKAESEFTTEKLVVKEVRKKEHISIEEHFNLDELRKLAISNQGFFEEMVNLFITSTRDGLLKMKEAMKDKNLIELADAAHKIIPPCRHVEANQLLKLLLKIESNARNKISDQIEELVTESMSEAELIIGEMQKELSLEG